MVVVFDTNVLVAATLSPFGASFQLLTLIPQRPFDLVLSVALMLEYEDVLKREEIRAKSHLTLAEVEALLDMLAAVGTPCPSFFQWRPQLPDPDDEMVLGDFRERFSRLWGMPSPRWGEVMARAMSRCSRKREFLFRKSP